MPTKKAKDKKDQGGLKAKDFAEELNDAALQGNVPALKSLIRQGADVNKPCARGFLPLYVAVTSKQAKAALWLCDNGADVRAAYGCGSGGDGNTPLHIACGTNQPEICAKLLACGASASALNKEGLPPFFFAINTGISLKCVELLLENGAKTATLKAHMKQGNYLYRLTNIEGERRKEESIAKALLLFEKHKLIGAGRHDPTTAESEDAFYRAAQEGYSRVVRLLLRLGHAPTVVARACPPLHVASEKGHLTVVRLLLASGANPLEGNQGGGAYGAPPVFLAAMHGHFNVAQAVFAYDPDCLKERMFHSACAHSADPMTVGERALWYCAANGDLAGMYWLFKRGVAPLNEMAFRAACESHQKEAVLCLLSQGCLLPGCLLVAEQMREMGLGDHASARHRPPPPPPPLPPPLPECRHRDNFHLSPRELLEKHAEDFYGTPDWRAELAREEGGLAQFEAMVSKKELEVARLDEDADADLAEEQFQRSRREARAGGRQRQAPAVPPELTPVKALRTQPLATQARAAKYLEASELMAGGLRLVGLCMPGEVFEGGGGGDGSDDDTPKPFSKKMNVLCEDARALTVVAALLTSQSLLTHYRLPTLTELLRGSAFPEPDLAHHVTDECYGDPYHASPDKRGPPPPGAPPRPCGEGEEEEAAHVDRHGPQLCGVSLRAFVLLLGAAHHGFQLGGSGCNMGSLDGARRVCDELELHLNLCEKEWELELKELELHWSPEDLASSGATASGPKSAAAAVVSLPEKTKGAAKEKGGEGVAGGATSSLLLWRPHGLSAPGALRACLAVVALKAGRSLYRQAAAGNTVETSRGRRLHDTPALLGRLHHWACQASVARPGAAMSWMDRGWVASEQGAWREACGHYEQAFACAVKEEDDLHEAVASVQLAGMLVRGQGSSSGPGGVDGAKHAGLSVELGRVRKLFAHAKACASRLKRWHMHDVVKGETQYYDVVKDFLKKHARVADPAVGGALLRVPAWAPPPEGATPNATQTPDRGETSREEQCDNCANWFTHVKKCSRCRQRKYCGASCQKADWKGGHKKECALPGS